MVILLRSRLSYLLLRLGSWSVLTIKICRDRESKPRSPNCEANAEQHCYRDCRLCGKKRKNALYKYSHKQHRFQFNLCCLKSHPKHLLCSKQSKQPPSPEKKPRKNPTKSFSNFITLHWRR